MKRGPKPGKTGTSGQRVLIESLGRCPSDLGPAGQALWRDAVAHLRATGRAARVYRHPLVLACRLVDSCQGEAGINRTDAARRWLHELGLTPASGGGAVEAPGTHEQPTTGRARVLALLDKKKAG